ncbi:MAG: Gfo/Idh/MocA family oxidoreductase [Pseudomonadota bacterium]
MARPRIAVCGAGLVGRRHIEQAQKQATLVAIIDPSPAVCAVAKEQNVPLFVTPEACLEEMRPDGVVIATPNDLHATQAMLCLDAGIPVLIEKPIADTLEAAKAIEAASARTGVPVLVGHHRRHNPIVKRVIQALKEGLLGDLVAVHGQFWLYKPDTYFDVAWRAKEGGGPTLINFIHDVDLLRAFCGDITEILAMRSNHQRGQPVEDTAAVLLRFQNGALGTFSVSDAVSAPWSWEMTSAENPIYPHRPGACYQIGGTHGSLSIPDLRLWGHTGKRSWWEPIEAQELNSASTNDDAFAVQFRHFLDVIAGAAPQVSAAEGRASLEAVLAVLEAPLSSNEVA